jgi:DNA-binding Lrp family transcriptional regulator
MEDAARIINSHPGVSHNYQRNHDFNLWFTIAVPPDSRLGLKKTVELLFEMTGAEDYLILNSRRTFKIGVKLTVDDRMEGKEAVGEFKCAYSPLSEGEKRVIKVTQKDLPIVPRPFAYFADILGMEEDSVILKLREFLEKGVARRFAAVLYHRRAGFLANGMVVWNVPPEDIEKTGYQIASYRAVSHCYERATNGKWQYNIFSVIHGKSREDVENVVGVISKETGLKDFRVIYSLMEFKKARPEYFTDDYYLWEENFI